jgi:hypothetical protein
MAAVTYYRLPNDRNLALWRYVDGKRFTHETLDKARSLVQQIEVLAYGGKTKSPMWPHSPLRETEGLTTGDD